MLRARAKDGATVRSLRLTTIVTREIRVPLRRHECKVHNETYRVDDDVVTR